MPYKTRSEPFELLLYQYLHHRGELSEKEKQYYASMQKGYDGEILFDSFTETLQCQCLILNDLLLKHQNTHFQIDTLLILQDALYLFEVKNFEDDYFYDSDHFYKMPKTEVTNPLTQLSRCESLFRQVLNSLGYGNATSLKSAVVFINSQFTLYGNPLNKPFLFRSQLPKFLTKLNATPSLLTKKHTMLADKLISMHIEKSPYAQLPSYEFERLRKGIACHSCGSLSILMVGRRCICQECASEEPVDAAVLRSVAEYQLLFPERRITTNGISEWCNGMVSKKIIRSLLSKTFTKVGVHQWTYYE
ncbi:nuclease-related domain-containing protein [Bacillus alkalicellulosilyticus]|uniref:nuclease-related domain-containing protein n=1 Tax=Alkalihalobacterium alkalicellulosilyticum TaxID=1912214 RepID=UPI0009973103|nr:nuclease-related domain-containing protein [Bacillus alkalicellulosilyticus]